MGAVVGVATLLALGLWLRHRRRQVASKARSVRHEHSLSSAPEQRRLLNTVRLESSLDKSCGGCRADKLCTF